MRPERSVHDAAPVPKIAGETPRAPFGLADTGQSGVIAIRRRGLTVSDVQTGTMTEPEPATVVVGVEGGAGSGTAIKMAAQEARYRDAPLIAVMAYSGERAVAPAGQPVATLRAAAEERLAAESALRDAVIDALGDEADKVELRTALGLAGRNLIDTARRVNAQLIVLAGRGSTSMLLGTVSQYVLRKAPCPVLVVPEGG
jgi:nucleotide-binding universal stress UspA family protein